MSINVTRSSMPEYEEFCEEIKELWESHMLTNMGAKHKQFQRELESFLKVPCVELFTNGHLALESIIAAFEFRKGSEIITTPFTFASTTHAIVRNGLVPVFCDINDIDFTIDVTKLESLITEKTCAILPVHVYGNICNDEEIQRIAEKHNLKVIYDAAHAFGVEYNGKSIAELGDASMFSFHATKVFNTIEGGAVAFSDDSLVQKLNCIRNFGMSSSEAVIYSAGNAKMSEFQAAMGICNLRHIDKEILKRKNVAKHYIKRLDNVKGLKLCSVQENVKSNYAYFPVVFDEYKYSRDEMFEKLKQNDINARKYFYPLTNDFECYRHLETAGKEKTPVADYVSGRVLTLPLYADLTIEEVDKICDVILN